MSFTLINDFTKEKSFKDADQFAKEYAASSYYQEYLLNSSASLRVSLTQYIHYTLCSQFDDDEMDDMVAKIKEYVKLTNMQAASL